MEHFYIYLILGLLSIYFLFFYNSKDTLNKRNFDKDEIYEFPNFLSDEECDYIINKAKSLVKKSVKKMGDKGRYDSSNQLKTLIVMQVLGDTKTFFDSQKQLNDREGFFTDIMIPDTKIQNNNIAQYFLFAGSDGLMNKMVESHWQK